MIIQVLQSYFPNWKPPRRASEEGWTKVRCPNPDHQDSEPSASLSLSKNRIRCFACGFRGDVYDIIREQESCEFSEAKRIAESLAKELGEQVLRSSARESGRGSSSGSRFRTGQDREVSSRFRRGA